MIAYLLLWIPGAAGPRLVDLMMARSGSHDLEHDPTPGRYTGGRSELRRDDAPIQTVSTALMSGATYRDRNRAGERLVSGDAAARAGGTDPSRHPRGTFPAGPSSQAGRGQPVMPGDPPVQPTIVDPLPDPPGPIPERGSATRVAPRREAPPVQPDRPVRRGASQADESSQERQQ